MSSIVSRLAACSWSFQPSDPAALIASLGEAGLSRTQLALSPIAEGGAWEGALGQLADAGIEVVSGMLEMKGEDYTTLESIRRTGGIVPDETWDENLARCRQGVELAQAAGIELVTFHAGFLPEDHADPNHAKLAGRLGQVADLFAEAGLKLALETGQEKAPTLQDLLKELGRPNLGVNFDPANMILYDQGDPIDALRALTPHLHQVHIKDATRTTTPGEWGAEVVVGTGQVDWPAFFGVLGEAGYTGDLVIEREAGDQRTADIAAARAHIEQIQQQESRP